MNVKNQLQLIDIPISWRLDDHTKEVGREGLRLARTKLRASRVLEAEATLAAPSGMAEVTGTTDPTETSAETTTDATIPKAA